jgi:predicted permease
MTMHSPPRLARWLLRQLPLGERCAEIEADLRELFDARVQSRGVTYARRRYRRDVVSVLGSECGIQPRWPSWRWSVLPLLQDLGYAMRLMRRTPGTVVLTTAGLGVALAVCTSVFSLLNAVMFRSTGVDDPASMVRVFRKYPNGVGTAWRYDEFVRLRDTAQGIRLEAALTDTTAFSASVDDAEPSSTATAFVSGGYLRELNGRVALGRTLTSTDAVVGAPPVAVISYIMWLRRLGGDPNILNRRVWLNGTAVTVVGVAERGFTASRQALPELWTPVSAYHLVMGGPPLGLASATPVSVVGRVIEGVEPAQAEAALSGIAAGFASRDSTGERLMGVAFASSEQSVTRSELQRIAMVVTTVTVVIGLVLLLACANVSNLLLASATTRAQEVSVRLALGASATRIVRQLLTESMLLGLIAGVTGLLLTLWCVPVLARLVRAPVSIDVAPDARVFLFVACAALMAGLASGLAPARHAIRDRFGDALRGSTLHAGASVRSSRLRSGLVAAQAAASILLVVLAGLLVRAAVRATHVDVGFDAAHLLVATPAFSKGSVDAAARAYWQLALERVRAVPGVVAATAADHAPFGHGSRVMSFRRNAERYTIYFHETRADYFATVGLRVVRGRTYSDAEAAGDAPVAVISETIANDFFAAEDPIGQSLERVTGERGDVIVGVVSSVIVARLRDLRSPLIYRPLRVATTALMIVRTAGPPGAMVPSIRTALHSIDPRLRLTIVPVSESLRGQLDEPRTLAFLAAVLAAIALTLAAVGIYGVTAFVVGQRVQEIGVRMALGATRRDVIRLLLRDNLRPVVLGLCVGVLGGIASTQVVSSVLYGVSPADPWAFGGAVGLLLLAATSAVIIPARRAARHDPAMILRRL